MKTPTILLHGALGAANQFDGLLGLFSAEQPVFAPNLPGHGPLSAATPYTLALFSDAVLKFMDDDNIARANIFGYSMGGYVALYLAAKHPERIRRVVTYGTKLEWTPEVATGMNRMFDPEKIAAKVPQFAQALASTHADWALVCLRTAAFLRDLGQGDGIQDALFSHILCPVTIGRGTEDTVVSAAESQRVAGLIPHGKYVELTGGKHPLELVDLNILFKFVEKGLTGDC